MNKIFILLFLVFSITGCRKENATIRNTQFINTAPKVFAGLDVYVRLPIDSCMLSGLGTDAENNIESFSWRKISGPGSPNLVNATLISAKVYNLEKGSYEFELTVTDKFGLSGKDSVRVFVIDLTNPGTNEIIFSNAPWDFGWLNSIKILYFNSMVPVGTAFKVYVKREDSNTWTEVKNDNYEIYNNDLYIYGYNYDYKNPIKMDVKIIF